MKEYIKPVAEFVELTLEEKFASGSGGCIPATNPSTGEQIFEMSVG